MLYQPDEQDEEAQRQREAADAFQGIMQLANAPVSPPSVGPQPKQQGSPLSKIFSLIQPAMKILSPTGGGGGVIPSGPIPGMQGPLTQGGNFYSAAGMAPGASSSPPIMNFLKFFTSWLGL